MSEIDNLAEEYEKALDKIKEIRGKLADRVIKGLVKGAAGPNDCTELAISRRLGMPRSTVRKVMQELASEEILEIDDLIVFKPYKVKSMLKALEKEYVSFTRDEFMDLFAVAQIGEESPSGFWGEPFVGDQVRGELVQRYLSPSQRSSIRELLRRFHEFGREDTLWTRLVEAYGEDELIDIWLMFPEQSVINDAIEGRRRFTSDWIPNIGEVQNPDLKPEQAKEIFTKTIETKIKSLLNLGEDFINQAEKEGYEPLTLRLSQEKKRAFPKESVWAVALSLRYGSRLGKKIGIPDDLVNRCERTASKLYSLPEKTKHTKKPRS